MAEPNHRLVQRIGLVARGEVSIDGRVYDIGKAVACVSDIDRAERVYGNGRADHLARTEPVYNTVPLPLVSTSAMRSLAVSAI